MDNTAQSTNNPPLETLTPPPNPQPPKKSNTLPIILIITAITALITGIILFIILIGFTRPETNTQTDPTDNEKIDLSTQEHITHNQKAYFFQSSKLQSSDLEGANLTTLYELPLHSSYHLFPLFIHGDYLYFAYESSTDFGDTGKEYSSFRLDLTTNTLDPKGSSISASALNQCFHKNDLPSPDKITNGKMHLTSVYQFSTGATKPVEFDVNSPIKK